MSSADGGPIEPAAKLAALGPCQQLRSRHAGRQTPAFARKFWFRGTDRCGDAGHDRTVIRPRSPVKPCQDLRPGHPSARFIPPVSDRRIRTSIRHRTPAVRHPSGARRSNRCATARHCPSPPFAPRLSPSHPARPGLRAPPRDWWTPAKQTLPRLRARLRFVRARAFPNDVFPRSFRFLRRPVAGRRQPGGLLARAACRTTSGRTRTPPRILQSRCLRCTTTSRIS